MEESCPKCKKELLVLPTFPELGSNGLACGVVASLSDAGPWTDTRVGAQGGAWTPPLPQGSGKS